MIIALKCRSVRTRNKKWPLKGKENNSVNLWIPNFAGLQHNTFGDLFQKITANYFFVTKNKIAYSVRKLKDTLEICKKIYAPIMSDSDFFYAAVQKNPSLTRHIPL